MDEGLYELMHSCRPQHGESAISGMRHLSSKPYLHPLHTTAIAVYMGFLFDMRRAVPGRTCARSLSLSLSLIDLRIM